MTTTKRKAKFMKPKIKACKPISETRISRIVQVDSAVVNHNPARPPKRKRATKAEVRKIAQKAAEWAQASAALPLQKIRTADDAIAQLGKPPTANELRAKARDQTRPVTVDGAGFGAMADGSEFKQEFPDFDAQRPWSPGAPSPQRHGMLCADCANMRLRGPVGKEERVCAVPRALVPCLDVWARSCGPSGLFYAPRPAPYQQPTPRHGTPTEEAEAIREHRIHRAVRPTLWQRMCGAVRGLFA